MMYSSNRYLSPKLNPNSLHLFIFKGVAAFTKDMRRAVIEEVFGEFRMSIIEAKHAAYNRDYEKVLAALHKLDREMFSEGI